MIRQITSSLYCFEDICNVYVIKRGDKALCVDFGLGGVLKELSGIGVTSLEWVLHTHHHRDQCQGTHFAIEQGASVAVPFTEAHFFTQAELFCNRRVTQNLYRMMADHFTLRESIDVKHLLEDFTTFTWEGLEFKVLPTPGHTLGSISLLTEIDGQRVIFCGDALRKNAELHTLYDLQYSYHDTDGFNNLYYALGYLGKQGAKILLPSHGEEISDPGIRASGLDAKDQELD